MKVGMIIGVGSRFLYKEIAYTILGSIEAGEETRYHLVDEFGNWVAVSSTELLKYISGDCK